MENAEPSVEEGTALCMEHYGALYRHLYPFNKKCIKYDKTLNNVTKSRQCPDPALVQRFLQQHETQVVIERETATHAEVTTSSDTRLTRHPDK